MKILLCVFFSWFCTLSFAQDGTSKVKKERSVNLYGHVLNSFTKAGVDAKVTVMTEDSTVVLRAKASFANRQKTDCVFKFKVPTQKRKYIIKTEHPDYETCFTDYEIKYIARNNYFDIPTIYMKRTDPYADLEQMLGEVKIVASKIKIQYRGDTIVFNANAFNVPTGSMLDGLIRQLPNTELKDNGEIYVNGRKVDYLTLNGENFFKGKNKVMLDNLPYYTVKNLKVYEKSNETSEWLGYEKGMKDYVMDVELKKEYRVGLLGNAQLAAGTEERYLARMFGLRYTDNSRLSLYLNANNVNESRTPGSDGQWSPSNMPEGERKTRNAGMEFLVHDKDKRYKNIVQARAEWNETENESRSATRTFLPSGDIFGRRARKSFGENGSLNVNNKFTLYAPFKLNSELSFHHQRNETSERSRSATFNGDPERYGGTLQILDSVFAPSLAPSLADISTVRNARISSGENIQMGAYGKLVYNQHLPWGDDVQVGADMKYDDCRRDKSRDMSDIDYLQTGTKDYRDVKQESPHRELGYSVWTGYDFRFLSRWHYGVSLEYERSDERRTKDYYLYNDSLFSLDTDNSSRWNTIDNQYKFRNEIGIDKQDGADYTYFLLKMPLTLAQERIDYRTTFSDTTVRRRNVLFSPDLMYLRRINNSRKIFQVHYKMTTTRPELQRLVSIANDVNPLAIYKSNPRLKNRNSHRVSVNYQTRVDSVNQNLSFGFGAELSDNDFGTRVIYDRHSGAHTYTPDNVDGNWGTALQGLFERDMGKLKRWHIKTELRVAYGRSVDFAVAQSADEMMSLSKVNNVSLRQKVAVKYTVGGITAGAHGEIYWRNATSDRSDFTSINTVDFNCGFTLLYNLPHNISLSSDLKLYNKYGYGDVGMNTNDLVWNMSLSHSFLKQKFVVRLEGFDVLRQLSQTEQNIDAQGRTVRWRRCIPSYAMLHLVYRFSKYPKKK